ncbi:hypothetical protein [Alkalibacillus haloalkaliphilus]|uniref:hypothetical protein n=1 Tax=Alkalibacillus haloalkaliphilus TaxID=94136 RepID=UPI002936CF29|nr:hypothetical protein [Alkalibacillus haloalkaliphilus]MDV2581689.1 hypothetical protein [Alkalibacillus haloalkaliphilus]
MINIPRKELYKKMWSIGITKTANELNVPYYKLKSVCNDNNIPLPTASYWSRLHMGKVKPEQPSLPSPSHNPYIEIESPKTKHNKLPKEIKGEKVSLSKYHKEKQIQGNESNQSFFSYHDVEEQELLVKVYNSLKVNKTLSTNPHKEITKYKHEKRERRGLNPYYQKEAVLRINSSSGTIIPEALPFIDSLFKALNKVNANINILHDEMQVEYKGYTFLLNFKLPSNKVTLSPEDKEYSRFNTYKYVAKGIMNVEVGYRHHWRRWSNNEKLIKQNKKDTFDDLLKKVFAYIFSLPQKIDEETKLHELREEERRKEKERQQVLRDQHEKEYLLTEELVKQSINFQYSKLIKDYIESEWDITSEEYKWAINKSKWFRNSKDHPDNILTSEDKESLIDFKAERKFIFK